jgi:hypothetical protein
LFVHARNPVDASSALIGVGPYGDIKNYGNGNFYLSWYPVGMLLEREGGRHPEPPELDDRRRQSVAAGTFDALGRLLPAAERIRQHASEVRVEGGWVYAQAQGTLENPRSTLHRRENLGVRWSGTYASVDTGKYSVAPLLAKTVAERIAGARSHALHT